MNLKLKLVLMYTNRVDLSIQMIKVLSFVRKMKEKAATKQRHLLCADSTFDFKTYNVFCGKTAGSKQFHDKSQVSCVITLEIKTAIQDICAQINDCWYHSVMVRI